MKVLLTAINSKYIHSNLAVRYLRAYTKDMNYECAIREFSINEREEHILEEIIEEKHNRSGTLFLEIVVTVFLALVFLFFLIKFLFF